MIGEGLNGLRHLPLQKEVPLFQVAGELYVSGGESGL